MPPSRSIELLLVDDDRVTAGVLCTMLSDQPVRLTHALDGSNVLQLLTTQPYDLALVDLRLPLTTGWDIVHQIRGAGSTLPIYLISALYTEHDAPRSIVAAAGANGFLPKPIQRAALLELLARHKQAAQPQKITL